MDAVLYAQSACDEIKSLIATVNQEDTRNLEKMINRAGRIFIAGAGRSLLSMKFFAMRLMHTNHQTYLVGEVCTPSIHEGDLLIIGSGSGSTKGMMAIAQKAKSMGANVALITMNRSGSIAGLSDCIVEFKGSLPEGAETAEERPDDAYIHVRPSGNVFEPAMLILLDSIVCSLMVKGHMGMKIVRYNHANLE